jgi:Lrp/AsnC family transcriptional regulator for asnA, asnC and gidA
MEQVDDTDRAIIAHLQYDGRMPFTEIANEIGVSEGAVRRRVKRLVESNVLQIVGIAEPQYLGWNAAGMIGITVEVGQIEAVAREISQFPEVSYLFMASGEFDLFAEVYCRDNGHLVSFLNNKLPQVPGVLRTQTYMILKMFKLSYRWGESELSRASHRPHFDVNDEESE